MSFELTDELFPLWMDLSSLLNQFGDIQDRLDPTRLIEYSDKIAPLAKSLENSRAVAEKSSDTNSARDVLIRASTQALQGSARFQESRTGPHEIMKAFQALRPISRAQEILYSLASQFDDVSKHFLHPAHVDDTELLARLQKVTSGDTPARGIINMNNERGKRGGYTIYVPEYYDASRKWPLVVALHGGSGHGADFLWSWLRDARTFGFILVAPSSRGRTWSLHSPALDAAGLNQMLTHVSGNWNIDTKRLLLTGISDGGTFSMLLSIVHQSPFTHYAPVAAAVHVLQNRSGVVEAPVKDVPIYQVHGARDWMFPVTKAREVAAALEKAGAKIKYQEIADLSHNYPRDVNKNILEWFSPGVV